MCVYLFAPSRGQPLCFSLWVLSYLGRGGKYLLEKETWFRLCPCWVRRILEHIFSSALESLDEFGSFTMTTPRSRIGPRLG